MVNWEYLAKIMRVLFLDLNLVLLLLTESFMYLVLFEKVQAEMR